MENEPRQQYIDKQPEGMYRGIIARSSSFEEVKRVITEQPRFARREQVSDVQLVERWSVSTSSLAQFFAERDYRDNRSELTGVLDGGLEIIFETRSSVIDPRENNALVTLQLTQGDRTYSVSVNTAEKPYRDIEFSQVVAQALQDRVSQRFKVSEGRVEESQAEGFVPQDFGGILGNISLPTRVEYYERDNPIDHSNQEKKRQAFYDLFMLAFTKLTIELYKGLEPSKEDIILHYLRYFDQMTVRNILANIGFNALGAAIMGEFPDARKNFLDSLNSRSEEYEQTESREEDYRLDLPLFVDESYIEDEDNSVDEVAFQLTSDSVVRKEPEVGFTDFTRTRLARMNNEILNVIRETEMLQDIALLNMEGIQEWSINLHRQLYGSDNALRELNPDDLIIRLCLFKLLSEQNRIHIFKDAIAALAIFINSSAFRGETTPYRSILHKTIVSGSADYPDGHDILTNLDIKIGVSDQQRQELINFLIELTNKYQQS